MHRRRLIILVLILALALVTASIAGAVGFLNPNNTFSADNHLDDWHTLGYTTWIVDPGTNGVDGLALLPGLEATSALWQQSGVPDAMEPGPYTYTIGYARKGLTANTAFYGVILYYENGTVSRLYKAVPAWPGTDDTTSDVAFPIYITPEMRMAKWGAVNFGKRGEGSVAFDYIVLCTPGGCPF